MYSSYGNFKIPDWQLLAIYIRRSNTQCSYVFSKMMSFLGQITACLQPNKLTKFVGLINFSSILWFCLFTFYMVFKAEMKIIKTIIRNASNHLYLGLGNHISGLFHSYQYLVLVFLPQVRLNYYIINTRNEFSRKL